MKQRTVIAVIMRRNEIISFADNAHVCNRIGMPTGEGYELCDGCNYSNHAEIKAIEKASVLGADISGATLFLLGHTYACEPCKAKAEAYGLNILIV